MSITGRIVVTGALVSMETPPARRARAHRTEPDPDDRSGSNGLLGSGKSRVRDGLFEIRALCLGVVVLDDHLVLLAIGRSGLDALHALQLRFRLRRALLALPAVHLDGFGLDAGQRGGAQAEGDRKRECGLHAFLQKESRRGAMSPAGRRVNPRDRTARPDAARQPPVLSTPDCPKK